MKSLLLSIAALMLCSLGMAQNKVLVFSKTEGYRHESIEFGVAALIKMGLEQDFTVTATEDAGWFNKKQLEPFDAVVLLNTT